jgi:lipopolysaccharide biosynthesis protein
MSTGSTSRTPLARVLAFYLPQFSPTPENDRWWGPGFTEWTNVVAARPLFEGHWQPRLPADTGFYDLRVPEVRELQAELARAHGIEGFVYWHYWFGGRRLLDRPFAEVLASGRPSLPFCLSWANESWERRWHGSGTGKEVLCEQTYSAEDDRAHARWLAAAFQDDRYIRIEGRPLFLVYRPHDLPDPARTLGMLAEECALVGLKAPYAVGINAHRPSADTRPLGFDLTLNFEPQLSAVPGPQDPGLKIYDYPTAVRAMRAQHRGYPTHPCVMVSWDNTARRAGDGIVFINATPDTFKAHLAEAVAEVQQSPLERRLVFVNAWNEWAEGNHLEPDLRYGHGWLEALRDVVLPER